MTQEKKALANIRANFREVQRAVEDMGGVPCLGMVWIALPAS